MKIKVMLVDDQRLIREGLKSGIEREDDLVVINMAENGRDALEKIKLAQPDVILIDMKMPGMDGSECTRIIKAKYPHLKVLMLTTFDEEEYIIEALHAGADGYLLKDYSLEKVVNTIRDAYRGEATIQADIAKKLVSYIKGVQDGSLLPAKAAKCFGVRETLFNPVDELTRTEKDIIALVGRGLKNKDISRQLNISEGTVKNYISSIYKKIGIKERAELEIYARENKYV